MFARPTACVTRLAGLFCALAATGLACSTAPTGTTVIDIGCAPKCGNGGDVKINDTSSDNGGGEQDVDDPSDVSGTNGQTDQGPPANFNGYSSRELHVRIVGPSGRGHALVSGSIIEVAGVVFGKADAITWDAGGQSGSAHGSPFFQTDSIKLTPGDNLITITAKNANETVSDSVIVTYNPTFSFQDRLRVNPNLVKVGKPTTVNAVIAIGKAQNIVKGSVKLLRVDDTGNTLKEYGQMLDDGQVAKSGDEITGDGLYSIKVPLNEAAPGMVKLRATLTVSGQIHAFSDIFNLEAVQDWNSQEANDAMSTLKAAKSAGDAAGEGKPAVDAAVSALKASANVAEAGPASALPDGTPGAGAWVKFKSGILGAVQLGDGSKGNRGGAGSSGNGAPQTDAALSTVQLQSRRVLMLDPFAKDFGPDEIVEAGKVVKATGCPQFTTDSQSGNNGSLHWFHHAYEYGVLAIASHGDAYFKDLTDKTPYDMNHNGSQEVIWTGHPINTNYFGTSGAPPTTCSDKQACGPESECFFNQVGGALGASGVCVDHLTADLRRGRVILGSNGTYGVTGRFFQHHAEQVFPRSLAYLGSCRSLWNGTIAGELLASGAAAVAGYNGYVTNGFAIKWGTSFFQNLLTQKQLSGVAHVQIDDPANAGTSFTLIGAQNLDAAFSDVLNASWESGNIEGWLKAGDGRVISQLGQTDAVGGKFMAIISTGLGYTQTSGELKQAFCIPQGKTTFSFWWKYYSEEFKEYCGTQFQDEFYCKLEVSGKSKTLLDVRVDDLCDGGKQFKGLTQSDVGFDQGDVWTTPWVNQVADITPLAGGSAVTVHFYATDAGDGIYDTAVLIDKLEFQ